MFWHYAENDQKLGPVSEEEFERLVRQGVVTPETLVWREGMPEWKPLREVPDAKDARNFEKNEANHDGGVCDLCKKLFPASQLITIRNCVICAGCKPLALQQIREGIALEVSTEAQRTGPAWEHRRKLGFFKAIWRTIKTIILQPQISFSTMKRKGGLLNPWLFYVILNVVSIAFDDFYSYALHWDLLKFVLRSPDSSGDLFNKMLFHKFGVPLGLAISVSEDLFLMLLTSFLFPALLHFFLRLADGVRQPFETTFRVSCYTAVLCVCVVIPFAGDYIQVIALAFFLVIGLAKAHEISIGKAVWAVLFSAFFFTVIVLIFTFILMILGLQ